MIYLLRHSSIFLELSRGKHQQVSGRAIGDLVAQYQQSLDTHHGNCVVYLVLYNVFVRTCSVVC